MMDGLAAWLRQIVAVVLLAGLVDLMLPNRALQRYVRLVAGLLILLTVAQPVLQFLKGDFSGRLTEEWNAWNVRTNQAAPASLDLRRIEAEAGRWRARREEDAARFAAAAMEEAIRLDVERSEGRKAEEVNVALERSPAGEVAVGQVKIVLAGREDASGSPSPRPIGHVEPIVPVVIDLQDARQAEAGSGAETETEADAAYRAEASGGIREADPQTTYRIKTLIAARYDVPQDRIIVLEAANENPGGG